jgi:peroxiredoxin
LRAYQDVLPEIRAAGAELVAISPQLPDGSLTFAETNALGFEVLSDLDNRVAREFGLVWRLPPPLVELYRGRGIDLTEANGNDAWELPIPATFVVDRSGVIRLASVDVDYRNRLEPSALLAAVRGLAGDAEP